MNNNKNLRYFRVEGQLRYHLAIINRRDKSPETSELVTRRIELAIPVAMRPHWNKNLGREFHIPRRPEENETREIKRTDLQLKKKERVPHRLWIF